MRGGEVTRSGKRPLRSLTVNEKIRAINRVHEGESKAAVARDIGVPESTLRGWCKSEDKIRGMVQVPSRNSATPESEAHSPASSSGANLYASNAGTSHSSEDEGPVMKRFKGNSDISHSLNCGVENTESTEPKMETRYDYPGLLALAGYRPENNSLLLQQLGMLSASANNFMQIPQAVPNMNTVGLVENGLQYTKSGINPVPNNLKRHSIAAIAPSQLEAVNKLSARKSLPPAAEAPATPVAASPNQQMPAGEMAYDNRNGISQNKKIDEVLWMWLVRQKNLLGQQAAQQNAQLCQEKSWFWQWYKQCGFPAPSLQDNKRETTPPKMSPSKTRAMLDNVLSNNNIENMKRSVKEEVEAQDIPSSVEEAVEHGEKFFKWLDKCSYPSVTRLQLVQFRFLLDNLKDSKRPSKGLKRSRK